MRHNPMKAVKEMHREAESMPEPVYLPSNEPYLGREAVSWFDRIIISCMEVNARVAAYTHRGNLSDLQRAACQLIPQGVNLALTIRELVRQGYLFGALVLIRPLIERAAIVSYLHANPSEISIWESGWKKKERPHLIKMLETMSGGKADVEMAKDVYDYTSHLVHGDPMSTEWNLVRLGNGGLGYSVGKVISAPELCDFICMQAQCYLIVLMGMMTAYFPEAMEG